MATHNTCKHKRSFTPINFTVLHLFSFAVNKALYTKRIYCVSGYRESAFSYAISAAGVAHSVARACSLGRLVACGCEPRSNTRTKLSSRNRWKWGGCSHNLDFGVQFSKKFLDSREKGEGDIQSRINLHNNEAGRLVSSIIFRSRSSSVVLVEIYNLIVIVKNCNAATSYYILNISGDGIEERWTKRNS